MTTDMFNKKPRAYWTPKEKFEKFHREHPQVYQDLKRHALYALESGRQKIGIRMLWERMRWDLFIRTSSDDYKMNNNYTSFYARLLMRQEPSLRGVFEIRNGGR